MPSEEIPHNASWRELIARSDKPEVRQAGADREGEWVKNFRLAAERNLYVFAKGVMNRDYLTKEFHLPVCEFLQRSPPYRKMLLLPRNHAKTSIVSHCLPIHILIQRGSGNVYFPGLEGSDCRILLAGEKEDRAKDNLRVISAALAGNELLRALWPERCWEAPKREAPKWNDSEIIIPRSSEWPDASVHAVGVGGAITGARPNCIIKDDIISVEAANSEVVMQSTIDWHVVSRALLEKYEEESQLRPLEFIIGCLPGDSNITMSDGSILPLHAVEVGDVVWTTDEHRVFSTRKVAAKMFQGVSETWTLKTTSKQLRATPNHPFLVSTNKRDLTWKRLDALRPGDLVVSLKSVPAGAWREKEFCWLFGFMLGDGWCNVSGKRGYVQFAPGVDEAQNERVLAALRSYFPCNRFYLDAGRSYRTDSKAAAVELQELGLVGTAHTKRVPIWVFQLGPEEKRAFLQGFCDADGGHVSYRTWRVELVNKGLLADLQDVACQCGVRHGRLLTRERTVQPPNSKRPLRVTTHSSSFNFAAVERVEMSGVRNLYGGTNVGRDTLLPRHVRFERVESVFRNKVAEPVYDLTVEDTHSFFANNLAVHNTHWATFDLYTYIRENDPTVEVLSKSIFWTDDEGERHILWPERYNWESIDQLKTEYGRMFWLLFMNDPFDPEITDFDLEKVRKYSLGDGCVRFTEDVRDRKLAKRASTDSIQTPDPAHLPLNSGTYDLVFPPGRSEYLMHKWKHFRNR